MNDPTPIPTRQVSKPKCKVKRYQIWFLVASVICGGFVSYLADYASVEMLPVGLSVVGTLVLFMSLATFCKVFIKD